MTHPSRTRWKLALAAALAVCAFSLGCGQQQPRTEARVSGTIEFNGKGVPKAVVTFWPQEKQGGSVSAVTNAQGKFTVTCLTGRYKLSVTNVPFAEPAEGSDKTPPRPEPDRPDIPYKYRSAVDSDLEIDVPEQGIENRVFKLR